MTSAQSRLCLSSVVEVAKVITPENASEILPKFFGLSSRDAAFVAATIRPVEDPPRRAFIVTPLRPAGAVEVPAPVGPGTSEGALRLRAPETAQPLALSPAPGAVTPAPVTTERPRIKPLDAERARGRSTAARS